MRNRYETARTRYRVRDRGALARLCDELVAAFGSQNRAATWMGLPVRALREWRAGLRGQLAPDSVYALGRGTWNARALLEQTDGEEAAEALLHRLQGLQSAALEHPIDLRERRSRKLRELLNQAKPNPIREEQVRRSMEPQSLTPNTWRAISELEAWVVPRRDCFIERPSVGGPAYAFEVRGTARQRASIALHALISLNLADLPPWPSRLVQGALCTRLLRELGPGGRSPALPPAQPKPGRPVAKAKAPARKPRKRKR